MASRNTSSNARQNVQRSNRDSARWIAGLLLLCVGIFVAAAVFFSFFSWADDQSVLQKSTEEREWVGAEVENPCGPLGARLGRLLVDNSFGVFGILIPVMLILLGVRIIRQKPLRINQSILSLCFIMILGSLSLGYLFDARWSLCSSTGWGGAFGNLLASRHAVGQTAAIGVLPGAIGSLGTLIVLIGGWILTGVFINRNFINKVNRAGNVLVGQSEKIVDTVRSKVVHAHAAEADTAFDEESGDVPGEASESAVPAAEAAGRGPETRRGETRRTESGRETQTGRAAAMENDRTVDRETGRGVATGREAVAERMGGASALQNDARAEGTRDVRDFGAFGAQSESARTSYVQPRPGATEQPVPAPRSGVQRQSGEEESPFVELTPDGRPIKPAVMTDEDGEFTEVDLSRPEGRVVMGRGGLIELERPQPRRTASVGAGGAGDDPFIEITVGEESPETKAASDEPFVERTIEPAAGSAPEQHPGTSGEAVQTPLSERMPAAATDVAPEEAVRTGTETGLPASDARVAGGVTAAAGVSAAEGAKEGVVVTVESREAKLVDEKSIPTESYDPLKDLMNYHKPPVTLLEDYISDEGVSDEEIYENKTRIEETLKYFGIPIQRIKATVGPTVTLYEIVQAQGVKISKIQGLQNDIAQSLKAESGIRIIAPIPGRGTIGIEVPNRHKQIVSMYSAIRSLRFQESKAELPVVIGRTIQNENYVFDLTKMPHLLVAGATGQGKSVGLNAIITSLLYRKHPAQLKFVMIDPKMVEFSLYAKIERHFLAKMQSEDEAIVTDPKKAVYTLNALCSEMDMRLELCKKAEVRNIAEYNAKFVARRLNPMHGHRYMPYIVVVIDEFADLIMTAKEVETPVTRLAQKARAIGIHLIIATQRPSVDVITGKIKANFPARIAFRVMQMIDSRTIIDRPGADQLIGRGDMLISKDGELTRIQCALVETKEVERIVDYISKQQGYTEAYALPDYTPDSDGGGQMGSEESSAPVKYDSLFAEIARDAVSSGQISTSMIQRNYEVGFNRAGRIMMQLERAGIVGRQQGAKPRDILFYDLPSLEAKLQDLGVS